MAGRHLENIEKWLYLGSGLTDGHKNENIINLT